MGMVGEAEPGKGGQGHTVRGTQSQVENAGEQKGSAEPGSQSSVLCEGRLRRSRGASRRGPAGGAALTIAQRSLFLFS